MDFAGRTRERGLLNQFATGSRSEFVVVYGRRRIGKTFLIRENFKGKFAFTHTGLANNNTPNQLINFHASLKRYGKQDDKTPKNWLEAFQQLIDLLEKSPKKKKLVFIDELPWLDTPRSGFLSALEHFWNGWASARKDIVLIACGSAASWIINKLLNSKGGLHNRVTQKIKLEPFTLKECEEYFKLKGIAFTKYQLLQLYMVFGGVPYYLDGVKKGQSAIQSVDELCFSSNALLQNEFENLYASLFTKHQKHVAAIEALSKKNKGLTREELIKLSKLPNGGGTTQILKELEESGFIKRTQPFLNKHRDALYQLNDAFSMFYLRFMKNNPKANKHYWQQNQDSPKYRSWSGIAFEQVCLLHTDQIKKELGISGVQTAIASWHNSEAQVDLLIDRNDQVINLFELKFSEHEFIITKKYSQELRNKLAVFKTYTKTKKAVYLSMLTTYGTKENGYCSELVQNNLPMNCLFL